MYICEKELSYKHEIDGAYTPYRVHVSINGCSARLIMGTCKADARPAKRGARQGLRRGKIGGRHRYIHISTRAHYVHLATLLFQPPSSSTSRVRRTICLACTRRSNVIISLPRAPSRRPLLRPTTISKPLGVFTAGVFRRPYRTKHGLAVRDHQPLPGGEAHEAAGP